MPGTPFKVDDGIVWLDEHWSDVERRVLNDCCTFLAARGLTFLSIPSTVHATTYTTQLLEMPQSNQFFGQQIGVTDRRLAGSAEQGILERFAGQRVEPQRIYARNQCFRLEDSYDGLRRVREFQKVEQFAFCEQPEAADVFDELLHNAVEFMHGLPVGRFRCVDRTYADEGYHLKKTDIEVFTSAYGWLETHSCSLFADEQARRFGISGADHTISNTGIASPRILIPMMEQAGVDVITPAVA